jgi:hypothetical protein
MLLNQNAVFDAWLRKSDRMYTLSKQPRLYKSKYFSFSKYPE